MKQGIGVHRGGWAGWLALGIIMHSQLADASKLTRWSSKHSKKEPAKTQPTPSATVTSAPATTPTPTPPPPPSTQILDGEGGFRNVPFGIDSSSSYFFGAVTVNAGSGYSAMTRPADALTEGGIRLNRILWIFKDHKLIAVSADSIGSDNAEALQKILESRYGAAKIERKTEKGEILKWSGKLVDLTEQTDLTLGTVLLTWRSVSSLNPSSGTPAK